MAATLRGDFKPAGFLAFDAAIHKAKRSMDDVEARGTRMSKTMAVVGKGAAGAAAGGVLALGLALGKSVSLAADFEEQLSKLKSVTGANVIQLGQLKKSAMEAGAATKFSALDAAKAQTELAKGGLSVQKIVGGGLKAALALAAAGELDLTEAAATTVNAMKQFNIEGAQSMHVADALATAANTTTADVHDFALALNQGGAAAKTAGLSFDETVGWLEALADNSVKGSDAGTSLKTALTQLASPTKQQAQAAKALNVEFFDQQGKLKSLPELARVLDTAFGGLTKKQQLNAASTLAGTDGMRALLALYASSPEKMAAYENGLAKQGTAAQVAAEKQDNLRGKIENLKGSLETAAITVGEGLLPGLEKGAEGLTKAINDLDPATLQGLGEDLGGILTGIGENLPTIIGGFKGLGNAIDGAFSIGKGILSAFYETVTNVLDIVLALGKAFNVIVPGDPFPTDSLQRFRDELQATQNLLDGKLKKGGKGQPVVIPVTADATSAVAAIGRLQGTKLQQKVVRILANDKDATSRVQKLTALGIPTKTALILARADQALGSISAVIAMMNQIRSKDISVVVRRTTIDTGDILKDTTGLKKHRAMGRKAGGAETALVGEGHGGELVGNQDSGWTWVDKPTVMGLGEGDYVIPTDPRYSGRALAFMLAALGVPGYAKGKKPAKKTAATKPLPIPDAVTFGAVPEDDLNAQKDHAREAYQKRKDRVHGLDVDIREDRKKLADAKGTKAKAKARAVLQKDQRDLKRYRDGGDGLQSLAAMRREWEQLSAQARVLHKTNMEIDRLNTVQETDRSKMETAAKRGDPAAWGAAKKDRDAVLGRLRDAYAKAVGLAKPDTTFRAELEGKLASVEGDIADSARDAFEAVSPFDGGMTVAERQRFEELKRDQSLAALTVGLDDDQAAAGAVEQFLTSILGAALSDPSRGGAAVIGDLADQVKQARDNVASFTSGGGGAANDNQDLQAQIEQQRTRADTAERNAQISSLALSVFQGAGDIGMGRPQLTQNNYMLHPSDPQVLATIAGASVAGMSQQPFVTSSRTNLGL
ncbi:MAG TPA: phage tail tape measure protein [Amycolatopsis sp.]|nr:phage tail tape measure protein [Amycolatopsis sp.]